MRVVAARKRMVTDGGLMGAWRRLNIGEQQLQNDAFGDLYWD